jgi:aminotransferase
MTDPGDEVLIPQPSYVSYLPCAVMADAVPVPIELKAENDFKLTKEQLLNSITDKTKILVLPYPNNPTGAIMTKEELEELVPVIIEKDLYVISDEIYAELTYGGKRHCSIGSLPGMKERTIVINGFSKAFAMTGWRMGIAAGPAEVIFHMNKIHQFTTMSAGTTSQGAALEALTSPVRDEEIDVMRKEYDERRKIMVDGFRNMGLDVTEPEGAFYVFPSIKKTGLTSMEFCNRLLQEQKVAVIPGDAFGSCAEGYIRCSYAYSKDIIKKCLEKIAVFVSQFDLK